MAINLSMKDFEDINLYSNANMERLARNVINKSSNAALVSMYEDQVIMIDHNTGSFFTADYTFDKEKASFVFENFEEVEVEPDESNFRQQVYEFFDDDDASTIELSESYKEEVLSKERFIKELVNESLALKDFESLVDYSELRELTEDVEIKNEKFFKFYQERLKSHPLNETKYFDWENPVYVSLLETTEPKNVISKSVKEKAHDLWKVKTFKESFNEAAETFLEDYEEGSEMFADLFEEFPGVYFLDGADRRTMFGKVLISNSELRENMELLQKGLKNLFESNEDIVSKKNELLTEADDEEMDDEEGDDEEEEDDDEAMELTPEEMKKVVNQLKKVAEKLEDEKLKEKMDSIISKLDDSEEGTKPEDVKEAVSVLGYLL